MKSICVRAVISRFHDFERKEASRDPQTHFRLQQVVSERFYSVPGPTWRAEVLAQLTPAAVVA